MWESCSPVNQLDGESSFPCEVRDRTRRIYDIIDDEEEYAMPIPSDIIHEYEALSHWTILHAYRGSIAHGMYLPANEPTSIDDKDTMAIVVPPRDYYIGLKEFGSRGTQEIKKGEWDIVVYELRKAIRLLAQGNPNMLSILWVDDEHLICATSAGKLLRQNRELFVGKHVYESFTGYAFSQLHRMEHANFAGYMGDKRKRLVEQFGYDTKNAAHLIRLLRMAIEFLNDGYLHVTRHDAEELLAIKRGEWSIEQVKTEADRLRALADESYYRSTLPPGPDLEAISGLAVDVIELAWSERA